VARLFRAAVAQWPQRPALRFLRLALSYHDLDQLSDRMASGLRRIGVADGTHVGLYLQNSAHYGIVFLAIMKVGAVVVNYSPLDTSEALMSKIADSRTEVLITSDAPELLAAVGEAAQTKSLRHVLVGGASDFESETVQGFSGVTLPSRQYK